MKTRPGACPLCFLAAPSESWRLTDAASKPRASQQCKHTGTPSEPLRRRSHTTNEQERGGGGRELQTGSQINRCRRRERWKPRQGWRLEGERRRRERRKRYVIRRWMNTAELFMRFQSGTSNAAGNIARLSSFLCLCVPGEEVCM